jgi:precorrin-2 dehydrogenase/sirohydrochlorin ferrochelatase
MPEKPALYNAVLDLRGSTVLMLGAGKVALQKLKGLPKGLGKVLIVAPKARPEITAWAAKRPEAELALRPFEPSDLRGVRLLFCCTPDAELNAYAARQARALGAWTCQAAEPSQGDLRVPAFIEAAGILLTLSTGGASPAIAKALRQRLEKQFKGSDLAFVLGDLAKRRVQLKAEPKAKAKLLKALCAPKALDLMLAPRTPAGRKKLQALLRS